MAMTLRTFIPQPAHAPAGQNLPYSPSWVDRLATWVDRLPVPRWVFYWALWLGLLLPYVAIKWHTGVYPTGTIYTIDLLMTGTSVYILALMHHLDRTAEAALAAFRPVLVVSDEEYANLHYRLTTLPGRRTLLVSLIAGLWLAPSMFYSAVPLPQVTLATSSLALALESLFSFLIWSTAATLVYHTIHQLRLVNHIYTQHTRLNLFQLGPLYAFSRLTARTAIGVTLVNYAWAIPQPETGVRSAGGDVTFFFALVALVAFFWPLLGAHRLLAQEKQRLQDESNQRLSNAFAELDRRLDVNDLGDIGALKTAIDTLTGRQAVLAKISTWPWQIETMRNTLTTLSLPLLIWLIQRLLDFFVFVR